MRILLDKGKMAWVSRCDSARVRQFNWWESDGYAVRALPRQGRKNSPLQLLHVFILGQVPGREIDHRDGDGLNCRRSNLRRTTHALNLANRGKPRGVYSSKFKGVSWHKARGKWRAYIKVAYRQRFLGLFPNEFSAALAYDRAARQHFGKFAITNL